MMLVRILEFGSNWWARFGRDPHNRHRHNRHAAYLNFTGVQLKTAVGVSPCASLDLPEEHMLN
jgi:hypothetical protein